MQIQLKRLSENAIVPTYGTPGAACLDMYATEDITFKPGDVRCINTGWAFGIPEGYEVQIRPRSGLSCKKQLIILNSPGTIDEDYRGEIKIFMKNISNEMVTILANDRCAQISLQKVIKIEFEEVTELSDTERGAGGFGSTGK